MILVERRSSRGENDNLRRKYYTQNGNLEQVFVTSKIHGISKSIMSYKSLLNGPKLIEESFEVGFMNVEIVNLIYNWLSTTYERKIRPKRYQRDVDWKIFQDS